MVTVLEKEFAKVVQLPKETYSQGFDRLLANYIALRGEGADLGWFLDNVGPILHPNGRFPQQLEVGGDKYELAVLLGFIDHSKPTAWHKIKVKPSKDSNDEEELEEIA
jgi:hypothetical protein